MITIICIVYLIYRYAKSKYIEANGDSYYRNVYLPNKNKFK